MQDDVQYGDDHPYPACYDACHSGHLVRGDGMETQRMETFGAMLRRYREDQGLTREELAGRAGLSVRSIAYLELEQRQVPRQDTVRLLAEALGLSGQEYAAFKLAARHHAVTDTTQGESACAPTHTLPIPLTSFVGRQREIEATGEMLLREDVRLLTLAGAGGCGKTRLAVEVAGRLMASFPDGVHFVSLASVFDPTLVLPTIARRLGLVEIPGQSILESLAMYLGTKRTLLVLDNFEQVVEAAPLLAEMIAPCPGLVVLVTSRVLLRVSGEHHVPVPPLQIPELGEPSDAGLLLHYDAARLFVDRAGALDPEFELTSGNVSVVAEICRRLDGLPLALELAAARSTLLSLPEILSRLQHCLGLLTGGARDLPERQRTIRATIEWSHELLGEGERRLFQRLGVFSSGWTLAAAEAVCGEGEQGPGVLEALGTLVDSSMVRRDLGDYTETRFRMLETVREYALESLRESGETDQLGRRHAEYFLALAEEAEPAFTGPHPQQVEWLDRLEEELDNLRAALRWSLDRGGADTGLRLAGALYRLWSQRGLLAEGGRWLEEALKIGDGAPAAFRAKALLGAGFLANTRGEPESARTFLEESLALYRSLGDRSRIVRALIGLGVSVYHVGDHEQARAHYEEGLELARELDDRRQEGAVLNNLGELARAGGDYRRAATLYEDSFLLFRETGNDGGASLAKSNLALIAMHEGDYGRATALLREELELGRAMRDPVVAAWLLDHLAGAAAARGHLARAATLQGAAEALLESAGATVQPGERAEYEAHLLSAREAAGPAAWEAARARGRAMGLQEAVEYALGDADEG